jgi:hypothetical protein
VGVLELLVEVQQARVQCLDQVRAVAGLVDDHARDDADRGVRRRDVDDGQQLLVLNLDGILYNRIPPASSKTLQLVTAELQGMPVGSTW